MSGGGFRRRTDRSPQKRLDDERQTSAPVKHGVGASLSRTAQFIRVISFSRRSGRLLVSIFGWPARWHLRAGRGGRQHHHRFTLPELHLDPAHPVEHVLPRCGDEVVMLVEGHEHRVRRADPATEIVRRSGDAAVAFAVDGVDRHLVVVEVERFDLVAGAICASRAAT